ncbi:hypothetical protein [Candidatus Brachybacter algidus]|uniref:hypothetical protein n=1 Tax=Candidatus Brachybacter algidus TaxID=2982024 RepID=UPI001D7CCA21|nr:hypothetical protein [Candidatus Brachybacter algidus]MBK6447619.1 hypothetical protein [Candidatus Brachybacter algidus]
MGDLTYVYKDGQRYFVFSLFDLYSAMMVGIYGGERMRAIEGIRPLEQLINLRALRQSNIAFIIRMEGHNIFQTVIWTCWTLLK